MTNTPLPPLAQEYYDDNRARFSADSSAIAVEDIKSCNHYFIRKTASEFGCRNCTNGWTDAGRFVIESGKVTSAK